MGISPLSPNSTLTRRFFFKTGLFGTAGLLLYSGEYARHQLKITRHDVSIADLPAAFDGMTIAQLSDIHLDEFTEPFFLRHAVEQINNLNPDAVFLTGDYVTHGIASRKFAVGAAWQCAGILRGIQCRQIYASLGNHDVIVGAGEVERALTDNGMKVLRNSYVPIERGNARIWLSGLDDPTSGRPNPDLAIPVPIRHVAGEPIILLCHSPDYARTLVTQPAGQAVSFMLSGHTHGGQVRIPGFGAVVLPPGGRLYPQGAYRLGHMRLYVNQGLGTVGVPFRFDCPPELTLHTLRHA